MTIWEGFANHSFGHELQAISQRLTRHPRNLSWAAEDLIEKGTKDTGRKGPSVDSIIRAAIIKQVMSLSYERLAFEIEDSLSVQAFTRIHRSASATALQAAISRISASTWERVKESQDTHGRKARTPTESQGTHNFTIPWLLWSDRG